MPDTPALIILAGGSSSRMWPLTSKLLMRFGEEPLMQAQLRTYQSLGFDEAIIVASPTNKAEIESITDPLDMRVQVVVQPEPVGMGDAILQAAEAMPGQTDRALYVTQVHDVVDESLHASMLRMYRSNPQGSYMAGVEMKEYFPGGYLIVSDDGHISGIMEKPGPDKRPSNYVNIVAHIHSHAGRLFEAIQQQYDSGSAADDHYEQAMDALMREEPFYLVGYGGRWDYLKYPWHVLDMMDGFLSRIKGQTVASDAFVADTASLVGDVVIASGAKIFPGAAVVGPAYIGRNTILGNGALVRHSMVLDHCEAGYTTEVARSYVASGCAMHACRVLDSIFAEGVNFSAGCTTANLRMDKRPVRSTVKGERMDTGRDKFGAVVGANAFLSVDVMTMPGVKVGADAQVGPGTHVHEDVPDGARLYVTQEQILRESSTDA